MLNTMVDELVAEDTLLQNLTKHETAPVKLETRDLSVSYGNNVGLSGVSMQIHDQRVTALIGPSGCGKSTFLRALNRMHELNRGVTVSGRVLLDGKDIYGRDVNPVLVRRRIGMVFQKPTPFPTMSVFDNVVAGLKLQGVKNKKFLSEICEKALRQAALFDEVKDRLNSPGGSLSGGQQQRLSIARALAIEPEVLLMDEPTSSLDPISSMKIEELIKGLSDEYAIVIVTHNLQQAARISDRTAFFYMGRLIEYDRTSDMLTRPSDIKTENYITGRFG